MRVLEDEQQLCPCYKEYQEFQKLLELKDSGLVVYCHRPRKEDIRKAEAVESPENTSRDVFILYNKKDVKITSSELTTELEPKNISCPRCRKTFEQARKLMQEVKSIDKKIVMGICDHCRKKTTTTAKTIKKPFCVCNEIVKKFISVKGEQKEDIKNHVKIWLSKLGHLLKDDTTLNKPKQVKTRAYSDLQINRGLDTPASRHEPEVQQMFYSEKHNSEINSYPEIRETYLKEGHMKQAVAFFQPTEHVETTIAPHESEKINTMISSTSLEDWDTTLVETYVKELPRTSLKDRKQEEVFEDEPSIDAKETLKRRHDISLRQMIRLVKDSGVPYSVLKRPDMYETPKIAPWAKKEPTSKYYVESEVDIKIPILNHEHGRRGTRDAMPWKADKYHHDKIKQGLYDSEEGPKKVKKLEGRYITNEELKLQRSVDKISHRAKTLDQHVAKSKSWHKKTLEPKESDKFVLKPQYSFFFPKVMEKEKKQVKIDESSSHLIKDILDKIRLHAERDIKRREEECQQKLEQDQKKKLAQEEKNRQAEEKKKQVVETKKYVEDQKILKDKAKRNQTKRDTFDKDEKMFSESEQNGKIAKVSGVAKRDTKSEAGRIDEALDKAKKYLKSKPEKGDRSAELLQKAKKELKAKPDKEDKTAELLQKAKKDLKSQPEKEDKTTELLQEAKKGLKAKPEIGGKLESIEKGSKDLKSGIEQKDKMSVSEKPKKDFKAKSKQNDKGVEKEQITKTENAELDEKLQRKKEEKEALKNQAAKEREKLSKETKKKRDSSEEIKVPMSKIQTSVHKGGKDLKSEIEQKDKISLSEKPKKGFTEKSEQNDKGVEKKQNTKSEKAELDEILQRKQEEKEYKERLKQLEQLRKEKEALKKQPAKEREELSKETKKKQDYSEEIKVSMSKIQKSIIKGEKDLKSGIEQKDKISVSEKPKKVFKAKSQQSDKGVEKEKNTKSEKAELDETLQRKQEEKEYKERLKQLEQLRKEKEALKKQATIVREELSKKTKNKQDSSEEIKVSMSKIQKSIIKGEKDLKSGIEQKDKISVSEKPDKISVSEKPKKDLKAKSEQSDKGVEKEKNAKSEKAELDETLQRKQEEKEYKERLKQLRKEKEALKKQATIEREELSKETKKKQDSSEEIKVSMSKIQKSIIKEEKDLKSGIEQKYKISVSEQSDKGRKHKPANKQEIFVKKQDERKEKEGNQKDSKKFKKKTQLEYEAKVAKAQQEAELKENPVELKLGDIKIQSGLSEADLILRLVRIKQAAKLKPSEIDAELIKEHKLGHHKTAESMLVCPLCLNSELEFQVLNLEDIINLPKEITTDIIIGEKILKIKRHFEKTKEPEVVPKLYRKIYFVESGLPPTGIVHKVPQEAEPIQKKILSKKDAKEIVVEPGKGVLRYALSDRTFIDKGWTMLPTEKVVRKMNVYRMRPAHPEFDWFEHNKNKRLMTYDTGERLAEFDDNGRGRWYYRSGQLALDYYDAEETNAQQRFVIYSSGEPDERGRTHPITILATFDHLGNGIVFDHTGKIRFSVISATQKYTRQADVRMAGDETIAIPCDPTSLKYNQTEGVVLDRGIGPVSHWKWHTLNDPPVLQQVMIDTQMAHKDPNILKLGSAADRTIRPDNEEMLAIEFDNFIKEKSKKLSQKFKPFQIKMKALKINEHFSLKVLDQATVYLIFRDGSTNLKLNIGMILDHQEIVDTDTAEVGEVSNSLERFPARTDSLAGLQRSLAYAQRYERQHAERERRLRLPEPCASADHLTAAASPPMRLPLRTVPTGSSSSTGYCSRKPTNTLYYNTRLL